MPVGSPMTTGDWNACAHSLFAHYREMCRLAKDMAAALAPLSDAEVTTKWGYTTAEVTDLKTGVNVANSLRLLSEGSTDGTVLTQSRQVSVFVGKFGGVRS